MPAIEEQTAWVQRQDYWRRRLGRLRLGVEPLSEQVARYRRVTWGLTIVPSIMGLMFVALFTAFQAPLVGLIVAAFLVLPIALFAWVDFALLARRAARYEAERREHEARAGK